MSQGKSVKETKTKSLHIINLKKFEQEVNEEAIVFALMTKEANSASKCPPNVGSILTLEGVSRYVS